MHLYVFTALSVLFAAMGIGFTLRFRKSGKKRDRTVAWIGLAAAFVSLAAGFLFLATHWMGQ